MSVVEVWTTMKLLQTSAGYLAEKGSSSPRLDAELLLADVLQTTRLKLYMEFDKPVRDEERAAFRELIRRRATGEPVAYLTGRREFYGREFRTDRRALVPRPETELIVDAVLRMRPREAKWTVADFGTGTGALAVTLAAEFPNATVHAVDIDAAALALAGENAAALGVGERVIFYEGSWTEPVRGEVFDWAVANPPYIADHDIRVESGVRDFEPGQALFAGPTGLEAIGELARTLPPLLKAGGFWICEFGEGQQDAIRTLLASEGWQAVFENDLAGISRLFIAGRGSAPPEADMASAERNSRLTDEAH